MQNYCVSFISCVAKVLHFVHFATKNQKYRGEHAEKANTPPQTYRQSPHHHNAIPNYQKSCKTISLLILML